MSYSLYARTDLAVEKAENMEAGTDISEEVRDGCTISKMSIRGERGERIYGRPTGRYVTVSCGKIWEMDDADSARVSKVLAGELREMALKMCGSKTKDNCAVLVAGLGNDLITADAIGPETVRRIGVTRHIHAVMPQITLKSGFVLSAFSPGVLGRTGIETVELIRGVAENVHPDIVIAVDALAARAVSRLASTVQLSDNGINPGSGIGNNRKSICEKTVGVPVLALGVPTVVNSSTLVCDALMHAGIEKISPQLKEVLDGGADFYVSPKEIDVITGKVAALLARSVDIAFGSFA